MWLDFTVAKEVKTITPRTTKPDMAITVVGADTNTTDAEDMDVVVGDVDADAADLDADDRTNAIDGIISRATTVGKQDISPVSVRNQEVGHTVS